MLTNNKFKIDGQGRYCRAKRSTFIKCQILLQVGWLRAEDQTVLSLDSKVVTHNVRISISHEPESDTWKLHIRQVKPSDKGCYMCQVNTINMKKQIGCLDVHGELNGFWFFFVFRSMAFSQIISLAPSIEIHTAVVFRAFPDYASSLSNNEHLHPKLSACCQTFYFSPLQKKKKNSFVKKNLSEFSVPRREKLYRAND